MKKRTVKEIDQFILYNQDKPKITACVLGCGQVIKDQIIDYTYHECILDNCIKWKAKCKVCRAVLGPDGNILTNKDQIYKEWDSHDRKITRIKQFGTHDIQEIEIIFKNAK